MDLASFTELLKNGEANWLDWNVSLILFSSIKPVLTVIGTKAKALC